MPIEEFPEIATALKQFDEARDIIRRRGVKGAAAGRAGALATPIRKLGLFVGQLLGENRPSESARTLVLLSMKQAFYKHNPHAPIDFLEHLAETLGTAGSSSSIALSEGSASILQQIDGVSTPDAFNLVRLALRKLDAIQPMLDSLTAA